MEFARRLQGLVDPVVLKTNPGEQKMQARQEGEMRALDRLAKRAGFLYLSGSGISVNQTRPHLIDCGFDTVQLSLFQSLL